MQAVPAFHCIRAFQDIFLTCAFLKRADTLSTFAFKNSTNSFWHAIGLGMRLPLTGVKIPKIGKRGFRSQKTPISHHPRKGRSESRNPHVYTERYKENVDLVNGGFFNSETLFSPILGILTPVRDKRIPNTSVSKHTRFDPRVRF